MTSPNQKARSNALRLRTDFAFWAKHCAKIRTKKGQIEPFIINAPQKRLLALMNEQLRLTGRVRIVILKARQMGFSSFASAYGYFMLSQSAAKKGLVVAHKSSSTDELFGMYRRFHKECPEFLRPSTSYSGRKELVFDQLDTGIMVATAGGEEIARGSTLSFCHLSECGLWPKAHARDNFTALNQAIPNEDGTVVLIESTPQGASGLFYELWQGGADTIDGLQDSNGYLRFFAPWFEKDDYRDVVVPGYERTLEEIELAELHGLDNAQLAYRRSKIAIDGPDAFRQEYPSDSVSCFLNSGRPVFNQERVQEVLLRCKNSKPIYRMSLVDDAFTKGSWGELAVYRDLDPAEAYTIGADVALGAGGDFSTACVLDSKRRQVAVYRAHIHPEAFGYYLGKLGKQYGTALLAVENNGYGLATNMVLRSLNYHHVDKVIREGAVDDHYSTELGFRTTSKTKPLIIARLVASFDAGEIEINDEQTVLEMKNYVVKENSRTSAEAGFHDDLIMALAIANNCLQHRGEPYINLSTDYVSAIG